ncbi:MAG: hypothetical protein EOP09_00800 [Proteobacteria bacterium]|nr:MAG: hypothetical protein EOP09_00800 [Pseudomonadota bacterium]
MEETKETGRMIVSRLIALLSVVSASFVQAATPLPTITPQSIPARTGDDLKASEKIPALCDSLKEAFGKYKWDLEKPCEGFNIQAERVSLEKRPLIYAEFGNPESTNRTLVLSMVHPDEITPLYLAFKIMEWTKQNQKELSDYYVVIAPFINPDGFYRKPPIRMNARGVDLNRNFATADWPARALKSWKGALHSNPRRFPGHEPNSEPETHFQRELIERVKPVKILSIHAPLNVMDYDGPSSLTLDRFPKEYVNECVKLRNRLKARSTGFFPGSLGNYSGQERGIPTITLELPTANPAKAADYWKKFQQGIRSMIEHKIDSAAQRDDKFPPVSMR